MRMSGRVGATGLLGSAVSRLQDSWEESRGYTSEGMGRSGCWGGLS
jgi:hypothetical protein